LSVNSDTKIGSVVIHVGDDDHTNNNDGATEQLGLTAFQLPAEPYSPTAAVLMANKTVAAYDPVLSPYAIPGNDMLYTFTVSNSGSGPADADSIVLIDSLPDEIIFYNGDIDDGGPETGVVAFAETGTGLTFNQAADLAFSNAASKPANFTACTYTPAAGYDPLVTYICLNPSGAMAAGNPDPEFTIEFRARID
jgi:uncharacterized repeat protein (TIGR01451 family)